jgi:hypothetical protein
MAASIAEAIHHGDRRGDLLDETDGASWLKRYVEVVCAGGVALRSLSAVERRDLMVPLSWAQGAPGAGGRLRQLGLLFVGRDAGEAIAYVPSGARSAIAFSLAPHVRAQGVEGVSELLPVLEGLAVEERRRREREPSLPEHPYAWPGRVPTRLSRIRRKTPGPERVYELESCLRGSAEPVTRRILISYRRTVGALRQTMEVATSFRPHSSYVTSVGSGPAGEGYWFDPAKRGLTEGDRDEWATSIRDAFTNFGGRLVFHSCHGVRGGPPDFHEHEIRLVRVHAPERVGIEPRVVYGEGMAPYATAHGAGELQASIDAANILLERVSR